MDSPEPHSVIRTDNWLGDSDPTVQILVKMPLASNSKICTFLKKPYNMGVYGLGWTPAIIFGVTPTPGVQILVQGPFGAKLKICNFLTKPHNMGVYELAWTQQSFLGQLGPQQQGPKFGCKGLLVPSMDSPGLLYSFLFFRTHWHTLTRWICSQFHF